MAGAEPPAGPESPAPSVAVGASEPTPTPTRSGASELTAPPELGERSTRARYVAIITDGNGRWARARGLPVNVGHEAGADTVKARLRDAVELGIKEFTVYSFSTENWSRSSTEVHGLFEMFSRRIAGETPELHAEGVRMRFIGRREQLPAELVAQMRWAEELTAANSVITMFVAFNYGGRAEIVDAAVRFASLMRAPKSEWDRATRAGEAEPIEGAERIEEVEPTGETEPIGEAEPIEDVEPTEERFRRCLYAPEMHDPDIIIRTSGERRLSNYLLWQSAYSELVFRDELWPDFTRAALEQSLAEFSARRRRFGGR
jgi:undecaprenyl diphosphate synthase